MIEARPAVVVAMVLASMTFVVASCGHSRQSLGFGVTRAAFESGTATSTKNGGWLQYRVQVATTGPVHWTPHMGMWWTDVAGADGRGDVAVFEGDVGLDGEVTLVRSATAYVGGRIGMLRGAEWFEGDDLMNYAHGRGGSVMGGLFVPLTRGGAGLDVGGGWSGGRYDKLEFLVEDQQTGVLSRVSGEGVSRDYSAWRAQIGWRGPFSPLNPLRVLGR